MSLFFWRFSSLLSSSWRERLVAWLWFHVRESSLFLRRQPRRRVRRSVAFVDCLELQLPDVRYVGVEVNRRQLHVLALNLDRLVLKVSGHEVLLYDEFCIFSRSNGRPNAKVLFVS